MRLANVANGTVDTDELGVMADRVLVLSTECALTSADVSHARLLSAPPHAAARWGSGVAQPVDQAAAKLASAADEAADLALALSAAADLYVDAEAGVAGLFDMASSAAGAFGGALFARMLIPLTGVAITAAAPFVPAAAAALANPETRSALGRTVSVLGSSVGRWLAEHPQAAQSPLAVLLVRGLVAGSDDAMKTALGMPPAASPFVNDPRLSVPGAVTSLGALGVRSLNDRTPVTAVAVRSAATVAPTSIAEVAARIPHTGPGKAQIRVERYSDADGADSWGVYVAGTVDMGVGAGDEAFDMESNAALMADADSAAYRAVVEAMTDAGVAPGDAVTIAGHSQGGLVAERIAQSGQYDVTTLVTFGAPSTDAPLPDGVSAWAVEHSGDVVPGLGGFAENIDDRVVITAEGPAAGDGSSAHAMESYCATAEAMDVSADPTISRLHDQIAAVGEKTDAASATDYRAERVEEQQAGAAPSPGPTVPSDPSAESDRGADSEGEQGGRAGEPDGDSAGALDDDADGAQRLDGIRDDGRRDGDVPDDHQLDDSDADGLGSLGASDGASGRSLRETGRDDVYGMFDAELIRRL